MAGEIYEELNFKQVVSEIRRHFEEDGFQVFDIFPDDPQLPIDLYCLGNVIPPKEGESQEEIERRERKFILVYLMPTIPKQNRLLAYQYYLSKYLSPIEYEMVLVVPHGAVVKEQKFYQRCGFGLSRVKKNGELEEIYKPSTLRSRMIKDWEESDIVLENDSLKSKSEEITRFFDLYIHDFADILPLEAERRHIDRKVLDNSFELTQVWYRDDLCKRVNKHLSDKSDSEYNFCDELTQQLWERDVKVPYSQVLNMFEPILGEVVPLGRYRDHILHQFQVFLTGIYVIDKFPAEFSAKYEDPALSWLIAATSHDLAYPIQYYNQWSGKIFTKLFNVEQNIGALELKSHFIEESFLECLGDMIGYFKKLHFGVEAATDWLAKDNNLVKILHKQATEEKNHGILQAFSLLKMAKASNCNMGVFIPSALSVLLHHGIWEKLKDESELLSLRFTDDPLSFLLIFCDTIQEWGRPKPSQQLQEDEDYAEEAFFLKEFSCIPSENKVEVNIWTPRYRNNEKMFTRKQREITDVSSFLDQGSEMKFMIVLEDKDGHTHPYEMTGP